MITEVINSFELTLDFARRSVADLDGDQMTIQPTGIPNHPAWTLGHLVYSCHEICCDLGLKPWLPEELKVLFSTGSTPESRGVSYPLKVDLLHALDEAWQQLRAVLLTKNERDLSEPLSEAHVGDIFPTRSHALVHVICAHSAFHVGQLASWRRAMGLQPVSCFI